MVGVEDKDVRGPIDWNIFTPWFSTRSVEHHATHLLPYLKDGQRIIDVGCGIGSITLDLARRTPNGYVLGVELNQESVDTAVANAKAQGLTNVDFIQGNAMDLPSSIPSDSFDIAHLHQVNVHLPDPVKALRSIRRVIKPGGLVSTRDMLRKLFTPTTAAIEENWVRIAAREDCSVPFTGEANHVWMHDAGFPWDHITTGAAGWEEFGENKHGVVRSLMHASRRKVPVTAEDVEWAAAVERDLVAWGENPASRLLGWDSWVVATK